MRPAVSPIHRINDCNYLHRCRDSNTIIQVGHTGALKNYAHYTCDEGLECLAVFVPMVPRTGWFRCSLRQLLLTRSTSI